MFIVILLQNFGKRYPRKLIEKKISINFYETVNILKNANIFSIIFLLVFKTFWFYIEFFFELLFLQFVLSECLSNYVYIYESIFWLLNTLLYML